MKKIRSAVILAGGKGSRLMPLTAETPKPLLPITEEKLLIDYALSNLLEVGIEHLYIVVRESHLPKYQQLTVEWKEKYGFLSITLLTQDDHLIGMPYAISLTQDYLTISDFLVTCADVIVEDGLTKLLADYQKNPGHRMLAVKVADTAGFSHVVAKDEIITEICAKDQNAHRIGCMDLGTYIYQPEVFTYINNIQFTKEVEPSITDLNNQLVADRKMKLTSLDCWWSDVGKDLDSYYKIKKRYESE